MAAQNRSAPMSPEIIHRRALSIARVLDIPPGTFAGRDRPAYLVMSHLAAMPSIIDRTRRHTYGNEILQNADALMQELPAWYSALTKSNAAIVNDYLNLKLITSGMEMAGLGSLGVAGMSEMPSRAG